MMLASIAEREQSFPTAGRLPVAFRSLSATKVCSFFEIAKEKGGKIREKGH
jgi:hypothetical protein